MGNPIGDLGIKTLNLASNKVQRDFMTCGARYQCYSGGFGSGKTSAVCLKGQLLSARFPNNLGVVCRQTYPDLRDTTQKTFFELLPKGLHKNWRASENAETLKNNSIILFRHFENGQIKVGSSLGWFFIDQAEEAQEDIFLGLMGRLRREVPRQYGMIAMNPNGEDWQRRMFVKDRDPNFAHFDSTSFDNQANLPPGYIESMMSKFPAEWVDRFILGKHDKMSGLIYHEYDEAVHLIDPFDVPREWIRARGCDWGVDAPATCVFVAKSPSGNYYVYDEYGEANKTAEEHAEVILEQSRGFSFKGTIMDASAFHRDNDLKSVADKYKSRGLHCLPATRDQLASILHVKNLLKSGKLFYFRGACERLLEEKKKWKWGARVKGKEVPSRGNDHYLDAERYVLDWMDRRRFGLKDEAKGDVRAFEFGKLSTSPQEPETDRVTGLPA